MSSDSQQCERYNNVESWCRQRITSGHSMLFSRSTFHAELKSASQQFGMGYEAIHSLFRNAHVSHMKRSSHIVKGHSTRHVQSYLNGMSIINIGMKCNYPPCMMARLIVENVAVLPISSSSHNGMKSGNALSSAQRKFITEAIRHPERTLGDASTSVSPEYLFSETKGSGRNRKEDTCDSLHVPLSRLSLEVREAVGADPMYGPDHDKIRHDIGVEYERLLEELLGSMNVPFETEENLRARGTAKTPDILLTCPLGLKIPKRSSDVTSTMLEIGADNESEWKMICWIDSKALYGDVDTHTNSVLPQVESYVHRFGPGLILYWFGHAPISKLGDSHGDVLIMNDLPDEFMLPNGEFRQKDNAHKTK